MPRIKLKELQNYSHTIPLKLRVTDINYGGHLGNDAVAGLLHHARIEILNTMGYSEMDLGDGQTGLTQTDCVICYLGEGFLLDMIAVECEFTEIKGHTFRMCCRLLKGDRTLVLAEMGFAGYSYAEHKTVVLPDKFRDRISAKSL